MELLNRATQNQAQAWRAARVGRGQDAGREISMTPCQAPTPCGRGLARTLAGALAFSAFGAFAGGALAADVGVSVSVAQPGLYGRIDIGQMPPPVLVYPQPVVIRPTPVAVVQSPIYLHVPPGHAKHWARHCAKYNACGQPVYFVQDSWYQQVYLPAQPGWQGRGPRDGDREGPGRGNGHGHGHGHGRGD